MSEIFKLYPVFGVQRRQTRYSTPDVELLRMKWINTRFLAKTVVQNEP